MNCDLFMSVFVEEVTVSDHNGLSSSFWVFTGLYTFKDGFDPHSDKP